MTHEADTANYSMSLTDDEAEAAFTASVSRIPRSTLNTLPIGGTEQELRISFGCWSLSDKETWECATCTFLNQPLYLSCEICGQARPVGDSQAGAVAAELGESSETPEDVRAVMLQEEEERLKQDRIKEIMALQQGIFNKIRAGSDESQVHQGPNDYETSFAWGELEDTMPICELPASRFSSKAHVGKKASDASNSTLSTAASSCSHFSSVGQLSSQSWLDNSSYQSNSTRRAMDSISRYESARLMDDSGYQSAQMGDGSSTSKRRSTSGKQQNSSIPAQQGPSSLRGDSARESYLRRALHKSGAASNSNAHDRSAHATKGEAYVDFASLKTAVEGYSVRSFVLEDMTEDRSKRSLENLDSNHSGVSDYHLVGGSVHSVGSEAEFETPKVVQRRGALQSSLPELQPLHTEDANAAGDSADDAKPVAEPRPSMVGALSVSGGFSNLKSPKNGLKDEGGPQTSRDREFDDRQPSFSRLAIPPIPKAAFPIGSHYQAKRHQDDGCQTGTPDQTELQDDESEYDVKGSLSRLSGARKVPPPSPIPPAKKLPLPSAPILQRNLYATKKQDSSARSSSPKKDKPSGIKIVKNIPILNRMRRKKSQPDCKD
jgi:hypothetical protein